MNSAIYEVATDNSSIDGIVISDDGDKTKPFVLRLFYRHNGFCNYIRSSRVTGIFNEKERKK